MTVAESVYSAVRTDSLYKADYVWSLKGYPRNYWHTSKKTTLIIKYNIQISCTKLVHGATVKSFCSKSLKYRVSQKNELIAITKFPEQENLAHTQQGSSLNELEESRHLICDSPVCTKRTK